MLAIERTENMMYLLPFPFADETNVKIVNKCRFYFFLFASHNAFILSNSSGVSVCMPSILHSETMPSMNTDISFVSKVDEPKYT